MSDADTGPDSEKKKNTQNMLGKTLRMCTMEQRYSEEEPRGCASVHLHLGP